jgi:hypothetical protein
MKNINYLKIGFVFLLFFSLNNSFAQSAKPHFVIKNVDAPEETIKYYSAFKDFDFEQYRFYGKRRIIKFSNSNAILELFSAQELADLYQREVHPLNIMNDSPIKEIEFIYFPEEGKVKIKHVK